MRMQKRGGAHFTRLEMDARNTEPMSTHEQSVAQASHHVFAMWGRSSRKADLGMLGLRADAGPHVGAGWTRNGGLLARLSQIPSYSS